MENTIQKIKIADTDYVYYVEQENAVTTTYLSTQIGNLINSIDALTLRVNTLEERLDNYDPSTPSGDNNSSIE